MADASLVIEEGPDAGREIPVQGALTLGRDENVEVVLTDRGVSRSHARVSTGKHGVAVEDLGSRNGTFVNGEPVKGTRDLFDGDRIQLGDTVLHLRQEAGETRVIPPSAQETEEHAAPISADLTRQMTDAADARTTVAPAAAPASAAPPAPASPETDEHAEVMDHPPDRLDTLNLAALASIALGPFSLILLIFSSGALFYLSLPCAIAAIALGSYGRRNVDQGRSPRGRGLAVAGQAFGIVGTIVSTLVLVAIVAVNALLDTSGSNLHDLINNIRDEINSRS